MAKKSLKRKNGFIEKGKFSIETSKMYIAAALICFHILPLFFVFMGETGQNILWQVFWTLLNPILIFCICCFHACRLGFCVKFPLITGILATMSVVMYYSSSEPSGMIAAALISIGVYMILAFGAEVVGGFLKRVIGGF